MRFELRAPDCRPAPQFALWYLTLVLSRRGILGVWSPSLAMPSPAAQFWLAVCVGACQVRRAAAAPGQALRLLQGSMRTVMLSQHTR